MYLYYKITFWKDNGLRISNNLIGKNEFDSLNNFGGKNVFIHQNNFKIINAFILLNNL